MKFSTKDNDNDQYSGNCAVIRIGAWWYRTCSYSNINGNYGDDQCVKGVYWVRFSGWEMGLFSTIN